MTDTIDRRVPLGDNKTGPDESAEAIPTDPAALAGEILTFPACGNLLDRLILQEGSVAAHDAWQAACDWIDRRAITEARTELDAALGEMADALERGDEPLAYGAALRAGTAAMDADPSGCGRTDEDWQDFTQRLDDLTRVVGDLFGAAPELAARARSLRQRLNVTAMA